MGSVGVGGFGPDVGFGVLDLVRPESQESAWE